MHLDLPQHNPSLSYFHCPYVKGDNSTNLIFKCRSGSVSVFDGNKRRWKKLLHDVQLQVNGSHGNLIGTRFMQKKKSSRPFKAVDKEARVERQFHMGHWAEVKINGPT